jgi:hypothetical protein
MDDGDAEDLAADELVDDVQPADRGPQDLTVLSGFLGKSDAPGHHRLFTSPTFNRWVDIPDDAIVHRRRVPAEQDAFGGRSLIWVRNGAILVRGEVTSAGAEAHFLKGPLSTAARVQPGGEVAFLPPPDDDDDAQAAGSPALTLSGPRCCPVTSSR